MAGTFKRKLSLVTILALIMFLLSGIVAPSQRVEAARLGFDENDTIYQIMVDRFNDGDTSNNATGSAIRYGESSEEDFRYMKGGDWQGVIDKLSYIKKMGYTAIWISPVAEPQVVSRDNNGTGRNTAYHGYNVKDPNSANPYFGTKEKLKELVDSAHVLGIKVIIDVVPNHIGDYMLGTNAYYDIAGLQPAAPFNNPSWYHHNGDINWSLVDGNYTQWAQDYIENHDLAGLDDIDFDNPQAKQAIFDSIKGWFDYTGADGMRVDAAKLIKPSIIRELEQYVGVKSFGENFDGNAEFVSRWVGSNAEWGMLDFPLFFSVLNSFAYGQSFESNIKSTLAQDSLYNGSENHMVTFIDNHDRNRFLTEVGGDVQKLQNALTFIFTVRGVPVVFQGTEQNKGNGNGSIITGGIADTWNRWSMVKRDSNGNVQTDYFNENTNTYQYVAKLNKLRQDYQALRTGKQREMWSATNLYAFSRRVDSGTNVGQEVISAFNNSGNSITQTIPLRSESSLTVGTVLTNLLNTSEKVTVQSGGVTGKQITVNVGGNSSKVYAVELTAPLDTVAPTIPGNVTAVLNGTTSAIISWSASTDNVGVTGYDVYRNGVKVSTVTSTTFTDTGLVAGTTYSYTVKAKDAAQNASAFSTAATFTPPVVIPETEPPTIPGNVTAVLNGTTSAIVSWSASTDNVGVTGYDVYRDGVKVSTVTSTTFTDTGLLAGTTYSYTVKAKDAAQNVSGFSTAATVTTPAVVLDTEPPTIPSNVTAVLNGTTSAIVSWSASTDNVGVTGYDVYRDGVKVGSVASTSFNDSGLIAGTTYSYTVKAKDAALNESGASNSATVTTPQGNEVVIYYKTGFTNSYIHYKVDGATTWTTLPGTAMSPATQPGYFKVTLPIGTATGITAALNNGNGTWDNNNTNNYHFNVGTSTLVNGVITQGEPQPDGLTVTLSVPSNTTASDNVYISGSFNSWNAADSDYLMTRNSNGTYSITLQLTAGTNYLYKFTRGSWDSVEANSNGSDTGNRNYTIQGGAETVNASVVRWKDR
ncbi:alpha amylase [Paenibacillus anaericanus]|uniref:Alpha amylase n=1 Tax=Paenibacillus anaericanus TaxID=170367 RepID=A0A433YC91_9BACL|nr:alpha-amylase family glycosyl hydrolase [Paenibacillus anaericanus]RUT47485.1 alpha amylase [Paenibacillus anaericanus]